VLLKCTWFAFVSLNRHTAIFFREQDVFHIHAVSAQLSPKLPYIIRFCLICGYIENLRASLLLAVWRPTADELLSSLHLYWGDKVLLAVRLSVCLFPAYDLLEAVEISNLLETIMLGHE